MSDSVSDLADIPASVLARIAELEENAVEEGITVSEVSRADLLALVREHGLTGIPAIFLSDEGTFTAAWRHGPGKHLSLQLVGSRRMRYVLFGTKEDGTTYSRVHDAHLGAFTVLLEEAGFGDQLPSRPEAPLLAG